MPPRASRPAVVLLAAALAAAGCGEGRNCTLTGKVSYQGKPVVYGVVLVQCADGTRSATNIRPDGSYTVERLLAGPVKIGVNSPEPPDPAAQPGRAAQPARPAGPPANPPAVDKSKWFKVPDEFGDAETSGKTTTVAAGTTHFDIQLP